jgi:hypothetical protein
MHAVEDEGAKQRGKPGHQSGDLGLRVLRLHRTLAVLVGEKTEEALQGCGEQGREE